VRGSAVGCRVSGLGVKDLGSNPLVAFTLLAFRLGEVVRLQHLVGQILGEHSLQSERNLSEVGWDSRCTGLGFGVGV
jgi:hypothetical protein